MGARLQLAASMAAFGTIGLFVRWIPLPSGMIAMLRGIFGALFLLGVMHLRRQRPDRGAIRRNLPVLAASGICIGFNWILLFEAYRHTTVATATLCYYMQPVMVLLLSPLVLKEKLTLRKAICVLVAVLGMIPVSGVMSAGMSANMTGIVLGLGAAVLYTCVVLLNKHLRQISAFDMTFVQLMAAGLVLVPYNLLQPPTAAAMTVPAWVMLAVVCFVHTGLCYALYFGAMAKLPAQTTALMGYIDPVVAIVLSALLLHERLDLWTALGAVMILGAMLFSEGNPIEKKGKQI
ncbi:MAG: DMT family transporter [Clostridia bacterium]|nr:DMT family transporter [Clostridia bacterium]